MKKAFIVSTGRTGTQFLANFFSENFELIKSVHEPFPSRHFRILSNLQSANVIDKRWLIYAFKSSRGELFRNSNTITNYIESSNYLYGFSGLFKDILSEYKVVHVVRDPRDYIKSHLNHGAFKGAKLLANKFIPYWFINVQKELGINEKMNHYELLAGRWVLINQFIEKSCKGDDNYRIFKYEDIFGDESSLILSEIADFIGLSSSSINFDKEYGKMNQGKRNLADNWAHWSEENLEKVYNICGQLMKSYSYEF